MIDDDEESPDHHLSEPQLQRLNQDFYASSPHHYFGQRFVNLVLAARKTARFSETLARNVTFGDVTLQLDELPDPFLSLQDEELLRFVIVESEVLLYHLSEVLIRLYLAHEPRDSKMPSCPWLGAALLRRPGDFKEAVRLRFHQPLRRSVGEEMSAWLLFGSAEQPESDTHSLEEWNRARSNVDALIRHYADVVLANEDLYNSAKHGFAVNAELSALQISSDHTGEIVMGSEGPSVQFLRRVREGDEAVWKLTTTWVDVPETLAFTYVGARMLESLWLMAKARYVTHEPVAGYFFPSNTSPSVVREVGRVAGVRQFSVNIGVEGKPPRVAG